MSFVNHYQQERKQNWTTPRDFFDRLHARFNFTLDGAAEPDNALLPKYSAEACSVSWNGERVFCNPPWSDIPTFIELAAKAELAVLLVPARCNSRWFHRALALGAEVEFFLGRPKFGGKGGAPFDCCLLIFRSGPL